MEKRIRTGVPATMNTHTGVIKELFVTQKEDLLVAVEVQRRQRKRRSFLPAASRQNYTTFICLSVTSSSPRQLLVTKVKKFPDSPAFSRRSQWTVEQLKQVDGINPTKDSPEFDLVFDNALDQWVATSSAEKCIFIQILYRACQVHWRVQAGGRKLARIGQQKAADQPESPGSPAAPTGLRARALLVRRRSVVAPRQTEFINCQPKLTRDASAMVLIIYRCKAFMTRVKKQMVAKRKSLTRRDKTPAAADGAQSTLGNVVQRMAVALGEPGRSLSSCEDGSVRLLHRAQQIAARAHKLALGSLK